jgi:hypothetical protein
VPPNFITRRAMTKVYAFTGTSARSGQQPIPAQKGAYAYRRGAWPATPRSRWRQLVLADRANGAVMPVGTLIERIGL